MRFSEITAISGLPGLFRMDSQRVNGMIVTSLTEGWTKFISNREHAFSPLESISIYTRDETAELLDVMLSALEKKDGLPAVDAKSDGAQLNAYFAKVLPDYDAERVHSSDIRKFIKWFHILDAQGVLAEELKIRAEEKEKAEAEKKSASEDEAAAEVKTAAKPAKKKKGPSGE